MLKRPEVIRSGLDLQGLSYQSAHQWCLFLAEEAVFNGGDPAYWMAQAEKYDPKVCGFVTSRELEEKIKQYEAKKLPTCTQQEGVV